MGIGVQVDQSLVYQVGMLPEWQMQHGQCDPPACSEENVEQMIRRGNVCGIGASCHQLTAENTCICITRAARLQC